MYVDNSAVQLVRAPKQFDVIVTANMFGDILSNITSQLAGSIGAYLPLSLDANNKGNLYEPMHGSAPDIAGQHQANPLVPLLSVAMMLRYSLNQSELANAVENAVDQVLHDGLRTQDIQEPDKKP